MKRKECTFKMTIRHMKIFCSICENDYNTTKAADKLHMTQPAVSLALKELEQYYGISLFDRIGKKLHITEAGKHFLQYAVHISSLFDEMETGLRNWDSHGIIRVGASITIGSQFLPSYVKVFSHLSPNTEVRVIIEPSEQLEKKILSNELDFALIEGNVHEESILCEPYMEDYLSVICSATGIWKQGQHISIEEFKKQNFLLREPGSGTRDFFEHVIAKAGFSVKPTWEAMSTTALVNAVINGFGISVLPHRMIISPLELKRVITITVDGLDFRRNFHIIYHKNKYITNSAKMFMDICRNYELDYPLPSYQGLH